METILTPELIWIAAGIILFLFEMMVPGFILAFFGLGAWLTALLSWINVTNDVGSQLLAFLLTSLISLIALRKTLKGYFYGDVTEEHHPGELLEDSQGEIVEVIEQISPNKPGKVKYRGSNWKAISQDDLPAGITARIINRDNITLHVKKISN